MWMSYRQMPSSPEICRNEHILFCFLFSLFLSPLPSLRDWSHPYSLVKCISVHSKKRREKRDICLLLHVFEARMCVWSLLFLDLLVLFEIREKVYCSKMKAEKLKVRQNTTLSAWQLSFFTPKRHFLFSVRAIFEKNASWRRRRKLKRPFLKAKMH